MTGMLVMLYLTCTFTQVEQTSDRLTQFDRLHVEYEAAAEAHRAAELSEELTTADRIQLHRNCPGLRYLPKFIAIIEENLDDEAALKSCRWIIDRCGDVDGNQKAMFDADRIAWEVISARHGKNPDLPLLCLRAAQYPSHARERFLRTLGNDYTQPVEVHGFAELALGELLARKYEFVASGGSAAWPEPPDDFEKYLREQISPEWNEYMTVDNLEKIRQESRECFQEVLDHYAQVPVTISAPDFRNLKTLGERAEKSLHALERHKNGRKIALQGN